jgi:hypothetical protein
MEVVQPRCAGLDVFPFCYLPAGALAWRTAGQLNETKTLPDSRGRYPSLTAPAGAWRIFTARPRPCHNTRDSSCFSVYFAIWGGVLSRHRGPCVRRLRSPSPLARCSG